MVLPKFTTHFVKCKLNLGLFLDAVGIEVAVEIALVVIAVFGITHGLIQNTGFITAIDDTRLIWGDWKLYAGLRDG